MSIIQAKAQAIAADMHGGTIKASAFDPALIGSIISVITDVINSIISCRKNPVQAQQIMARGGPIEKAALRQSIRRYTKHAAIRSPMMDSALKIARQTTVSEIKDMMTEVAPGIV